eukprot:239967_1
MNQRQFDTPPVRESPQLVLTVPTKKPIQCESRQRPSQSSVSPPPPPPPPPVVNSVEATPRRRHDNIVMPSTPTMASSGSEKEKNASAQRMKPAKKENRSLTALIAAGLVKSGKDVLSMNYEGNTFVGTLLEDGNILYNEHCFSSVSGFALTCLREIKPRAGVNGWSSVYYKGKTLHWIWKTLQTMINSGAIHTPQRRKHGLTRNAGSAQVISPAKRAYKKRNILYNEHCFSSVSGFALTCLREIKPRAGVNGWSSVYYKGKTLHWIWKTLQTMINSGAIHTPQRRKHGLTRNAGSAQVISPAKRAYKKRNILYNEH